METFLTLHNLLQDLTWQHSSSFLIQITFTLASFFEEVKHPTGQPLPLGSRAIMDLSRVISKD
jgi:hypothetical protein